MQCLIHTESLHHDAKHKTSNKIDRRNDQTCRGISLNVLGRTIHGTEECSLILNLLSAFLRLLIRNGSCIQIGIDRHLLTGHGIERKTCRHLGYSLGTFVDHDHLDQYQHDENDYADDQITSADKVTERGNNITGISV